MSHLSLSAQTHPPALITSPPTSPHQTLLQPSKHKSTPTITACASSFEVKGIKKSPKADEVKHCRLALWITTARLQSNLIDQDPLFNCPSTTPTTFLPYTPRNTNSHVDKAVGNPLTFLESLLQSSSSVGRLGRLFDNSLTEILLGSRVSSQLPLTIFFCHTSTFPFILSLSLFPLCPTCFHQIINESLKLDGWFLF